MKIPGLTSTLPAEPIGVSTPAPPPDDRKLAKACEQFEGMLVRQILQQGLKPLLATPPGSGESGNGVYGYLINDALANGVAGKRGLGISSMLQTQLTPHPRQAAATERE